jgi:S-disulfanyl-L-cysteine oxidoreductase SoxD
MKPFIDRLLVALYGTVRWGGDESPRLPAASVVDRGGVLYQANCATCHGADGEGETPNWKRLNADKTYPAPPHDSTGHTWHHADKMLFDIVKNGGSQYNSPAFQSRMPAWDNKLSDDEIRAVLAYIKTMWGPTEIEAQRDVTKMAESN